jgi:hypothetical protein
MVQAQTIQLQEGINKLQERIREEVHRRQDELLQQAESLREAQTFMQVNIRRDHLPQSHDRLYKQTGGQNAGLQSSCTKSCPKEA